MATIQTVEERIKTIKRKLTEAGSKSAASASREKTRPLKKRLKRLQRRRRVLMSYHKKTTRPEKTAAAPAAASEKSE